MQRRRRRNSSSARSVARARRHRTVLATEHGIQSSQRHAGDAVGGDGLRAVLRHCPVALRAPRLDPGGEVVDGASTVSGDKEAECTAR